MAAARIIHGNCLEILPTLESGSINAIIADPPYPHIKRSYGYWTEAEWFALMRPVVAECRRLLKPTGSAVFILQPNSERVGRMRTWLWEFMVWVGKEWGIVQDAWWWNYTAPPSGHTIQGDLLRCSIKACVWCGPFDCYRDQSSVLWSESEGNAAMRQSARWERKYRPSGYGMNKAACAAKAIERGGVTPFNLFPVANSNSATSAGAHGHGAGTPLKLCLWWTRYICPPGGVVLDPFAGSGTTGVACALEGREFIGVEKESQYVEIARKRIAKVVRHWNRHPNLF